MGSNNAAPRKLTELEERIFDAFLNHESLSLKDQMGLEAIKLQLRQGEISCLRDVFSAKGFSPETYLVSLSFLTRTPIADFCDPEYPIVPQTEAIAKVPKDLAEETLALPIRVEEGNILVVVMHDPANRSAVKKLEEATKMRIQPKISRQDVRDYISLYYQAPSLCRD